MRATRIVIACAVLGLSAAGCATLQAAPAPPDITVVPATIPAPPPSPLISDACRAQLHAIDGGDQLLAHYDFALGADATGTFGPTQTKTDLDGFAYFAAAAGATDCGQS